MMVMMMMMKDKCMYLRKQAERKSFPSFEMKFGISGGSVAVPM
jgi:hypothetical protein